jgi:malonate transporter
MEPRGYTSVLQGAIRQNSYIGLAAAGPLFGPAGVALAAVGIAAVIPMVNAMSVWTLTRLHGGGEGGASPNLAQMLWRMITTPIIAACLVGLAINGTGIGLHPLLAEVLSLLGAAALPLGLLAVGAGLEWRAVRRGFGLIALSNTMKLVAVPLGTIAICRWLEADAISTGVALLFAALPSSASSYVLSRQLDGDHELMAAILTTQVLVAAVTIPALLILFA